MSVDDEEYTSDKCRKYGKRDKEEPHVGTVYRIFCASDGTMFELGYEMPESGFRFLRSECGYSLRAIYANWSSSGPSGRSFVMVVGSSGSTNSCLNVLEKYSSIV